MILSFGILTSGLLPSMCNLLTTAVSSVFCVYFIFLTFCFNLLICRYVMSPPIRSSGHNRALQAALSTGLLQVNLFPRFSVFMFHFVEVLHEIENVHFHRLVSPFFFGKIPIILQSNFFYEAARKKNQKWKGIYKVKSYPLP